MKIKSVPSFINHRPPVLRPRSSAFRPSYSLRKHSAFWGLTFAGQKAVFDSEQGAFYVAYLLLHHPQEPIHGMALALKTNALYGIRSDLSGASLITDPATGKTMPLPLDAELVERNLNIDEAEAAAALRRKQRQLEATVDDDDQTEPVKAEALRDLEAIYEFQRNNPTQIWDTAENTVRTVRRAITRFHEHLANSVDAKGNPHPVLRSFAEHLHKYLLIPSARYSSAGHSRNRSGLAGFFTYERPSHITWNQ